MYEKGFSVAEATWRIPSCIEMMLLFRGLPEFGLTGTKRCSLYTNTLSTHRGYHRGFDGNWVSVIHWASPQYLFGLHCSRATLPFGGGNSSRNAQINNIANYSIYFLRCCSFRILSFLLPVNRNSTVEFQKIRMNLQNSLVSICCKNSTEKEKKRV